MQTLTMRTSTRQFGGLCAPERACATWHAARQKPRQAAFGQHATARRSGRRIASAASASSSEQPAAPAPSAAKVDTLGILNFRYEAEIETGTLVVTLASQQRLPAVVDLLVDTFAPRFDIAGLFHRYMHSQITDRVTAFSRAAPAAVVLVALLAPPEPASEAAAPQSQPAQQQPGVAPGQDGSWAPNNAFMEAMRKAQRDAASVVVGSAQLALQEGTWPPFVSKASPGAVYLSAVCTSPEYRRQGIATHLLEAAEQLTRLAGQGDIHIHVGLKNTAANATYQQQDYLEGGADSVWAALGRWQLMTKNVK